MFDHSRATPLPSLFTSWGLTNWLFQIWFSSASTTGFKLKFQQVIGYRALPSQPQTTKRADPISKRIYVGLFVAKLLETLASKGTSRAEKGWTQQELPQLQKWSSSFFKRYHSCRILPENKQEVRLETPLFATVFAWDILSLQRFCCRNCRPKPRCHHHRHRSGSTAVEIRDSVLIGGGKFVARKEHQICFAPMMTGSRGWTFHLQYEGWKGQFFSWRVVQFFNLPKPMARQAAADQACTQLIRRANPNCMHITTAWGQFRSATPDTRWGGRLRCDVLFTFGIKFALRPWWQDPQAGPSNAGQVLQCGEFAERWISWNLTVARLPRHYKQ